MSGQQWDEIRFDENGYARPNQPWVCGWASMGRACPLGPARFGKCRSAHECVPYRKGSTWTCARTRARGGPCADGPLPDGSCCRSIPTCQPSRSIMAMRGVASLCCFAAAVGFVLVTLGSSQRARFASPGDLASQHSSVVHECQDCHDGGNEPLSGWIHAAFDSESAQRQSDLCLKCHADLGPHALAPHSHDPHSLALLTRDLQTAKPARSLVLNAAHQGLGSPGRSDGSLACASCHREHHGSDFDLTALSDRQCQVCHTVAFDSFVAGHPDFTLVPYQRRRNLYFDHSSHYGKHFPSLDNEGQRSCHACHNVDSGGQSMSLGGFEQTCAECHSEQVTADDTPGLLLAALPGLDAQTIRDKGLDVGEWPELYPRHVQAAGRIGPVMELLLQAGEDFDELQKQLAGVDLSQLGAADDKQVQAAQRWAWAFKALLMDVVEGGQTELRRRLSKSFGARVPLADIDRLVNRIPVELLRMMQERWLPNLPAELRDRAGGASAAPEVTDAPAAAGESPSQLGAVRDRQRYEAGISSGWYLRDADLSLRYRAVGHADDMLRLWLDVTGRFNPAQASAGSAATGGGITMRAAFLAAASPYAGGRCTKCHTANATAADGVRMNWTASRPDESFTRFTHGPHIRLLQDVCQSCHTSTGDLSSTDWHLFRPEFIRADGSLATDPNRMHSDFEGISKATCAHCHTSQDAGDRCLTCHNYHVPRAGLTE